MTAPAVDALRFGYGLGIGAALGLFYDFLRPLHPKRKNFADFLFVIALLYGWLYLQFAVCQADVRFPYTLALFVGIFLWTGTVGRLFRPVFSRFWAIMDKIWNLTVLPLKKTLKMTKKIVCICEKMGYNRMESIWASTAQTRRQSWQISKNSSDPCVWSESKAGS